MPQRSAPSRVILLGSDYAGDLDLTDVEFKRRPYDNNKGKIHFRINLEVNLVAYRQAKQANRMLNVAWAKRFSDANVTVNCYHPGGIKSKLASDLGTCFHVRNNAQVVGLQLSGTPEDGARTGLELATAQELEGVTGKYFIGGKSTKDLLASNEDANERLYKLCEELTERVAMGR